MQRKIAPRGTLSSLTDDRPTFKFMVTLPKELVRQIDVLYPRTKFKSRSKVIETILSFYVSSKNLVSEAEE
jgi:metal-responsive CopG/Arc/MetJ family transcriptional regulator